VDAEADSVVVEGLAALLGAEEAHGWWPWCGGGGAALVTRWARLGKQSANQSISQSINESMNQLTELGLLLIDRLFRSPFSRTS
jgi:hypothetical protein